MALVDSIIITLVSLLIGAVAISLGARLVIDRDVGFSRAVLAAAVGALIWGLLSFFVGWIPILGLVLMLVVWVGVINWAYPGGWVTAAGIGFVAWIIALAILYVLALVGVVGFEALGIPGA